MEAYVNTPEMQRLRKEDYKEFRKRYNVFRLKTTEWYCDVCNNGKNYRLGGKWTHLKSKKHERNYYEQNPLIKFD